MVATTTRQVRSRSEAWQRLSVDDRCCAPLGPHGVDRRSLAALDWFHGSVLSIYLEEERYMAARLGLDADAIAAER